MRFMLIMIPNLTEQEYGSPTTEMVEAMSRYNEELTKAGVLLALDGLHPPSACARVRFAGGTPAVTDGPFAEAKEIVGGYWMIQAKSKDDAVAWARRIPAAEGDVVEVRQVYEMSDFPEDVQAAAQLSEPPPAQPAER
jgi:hypothetical protein